MFQCNTTVTFQYNTTVTFQYNTTVTFQCNKAFTFQCNTIFTSCELVSSIKYKLTRAYSEDSNQSVHPPSLIRVVVFCLKKCFGLLATHIVHIVLQMRRLTRVVVFRLKICFGPLTTHRTPIEDADKTARMRRLISVFDGCTCLLEYFA